MNILKDSSSQAQRYVSGGAVKPTKQVKQDLHEASRDTVKLSSPSDDPYSWLETGKIALKCAAFAAPAALGAASGNFNLGALGMLGSAVVPMVASRHSNDDGVAMVGVLLTVAGVAAMSAMGGFGGYTGAATAIAGLAALGTIAHRSAAAAEANA